MDGLEGQEWGRTYLSRFHLIDVCLNDLNSNVLRTNHDSSSEMTLPELGGASRKPVPGCG